MEAAPRRDIGIELLRFASALLIVLWHVPDLAPPIPISWSLTAFTAISMLYGRRKPGACGGHYLRTLSRRLLIPWVIWSVIYVVLRGGARVGELDGWFASLRWTDLLVGGVLPLWYLPFVFGVLALESGLRSFVGKWFSSHFESVLVVIALALAAVLSSLAHGWFDSGPVPMPQYGFVLPTAFGCLAWRGLSDGDGWTPGLACGAVVLTVVLGGSYVVRGDGLWPVLGVVLVLVAWSRWRGSSPQAIWMGKASWPLYLLHPICIATLLRTSIPLAGVWIGSCLLAIVGSYVILNVPHLERPLLLGDFRGFRRSAKCS